MGHHSNRSGSDRHRLALTKRQRAAVARGRPPDADTLVVAKRLRDQLSHLGINPWQLSKRAGLYNSVVYGYLEPHRYGLRSANLSVLRALANALNLSLHDLIDP